MKSTDLDRLHLIVAEETIPVQRSAEVPGRMGKDGCDEISLVELRRRHKAARARVMVQEALRGYVGWGQEPEGLEQG